MNGLICFQPFEGSICELDKNWGREERCNRRQHPPAYSCDVKEVQVGAEKGNVPLIREAQFILADL